MMQIFNLYELNSPDNAVVAYSRARYLHHIGASKQEYGYWLRRAVELSPAGYGENISLLAHYAGDGSYGEFVSAWSNWLQHDERRLDLTLMRSQLYGQPSSHR